MPPHSDTQEWLDAPGDHSAQLEGNLRDIRRLNAWFGGSRLATRSVERVLQGRSSARILDVATGSADIPLALSKWAARRGITLDLVAADISQEVIAEARRHLVGSAVRLARADARALPWQDDAFDVVCCCLALHHFSPPDAIQVLREMWRVASWGVVITDLTRSYPAYIGTWLATHTLAPNVLTRHDGPLSVMRAYTPREMYDLAVSAGIANPIVQPTFPFRQTLIGLGPTRSEHA